MHTHTHNIHTLTQINDRTYFEIANNQSIAQLSILLIIVGLFIMIVGAVGAVGAIFGNTIFGRITLGLVSSVTMVILCHPFYFLFSLSPSLPLFLSLSLSLSLSHTHTHTYLSPSPFLPSLPFFLLHIHFNSTPLFLHCWSSVKLPLELLQLSREMK